MSRNDPQAPRRDNHAGDHHAKPRQNRLGAPTRLGQYLLRRIRPQDAHLSGLTHPLGNLRAEVLVSEHHRWPTRGRHGASVWL
jgi:hypothetical protein